MIPKVTVEKHFKYLVQKYDGKQWNDHFCYPDNLKLKGRIILKINHTIDKRVVKREIKTTKLVEETDHYFLV